MFVSNLQKCYGHEAWITDMCTIHRGYVLLAIGGPLIFLSQFHIQNTFPKNSGLVLSLIIGAFDCSSFPFLIYRALDNKYVLYSSSSVTSWTLPQLLSTTQVRYHHQNVVLGIPCHPRSVRYQFSCSLGYLSVTCFLCSSRLVLQQLTVAPQRSYKQGDFDEDGAPVISAPAFANPAPDDCDNENPMRGMMRRRSSARPSFGAGFSATVKDPEDRPDLERPAHFNDPLMGAMAGYPVKKQLASSYFM